MSKVQSGITYKQAKIRFSKVFKIVEVMVKKNYKNVEMA